MATVVDYAGRPPGAAAIKAEWRVIPGTGGSYEASSQGEVRSVDREIMRQGRVHHLRGRTLQPHRMQSGHLRVNIKVNGRPFESLVHRLVLLAFVGNAPEGTEACHGNGVPDDNRIENLRWDTRSSNLRDMVRHGGHRAANRDQCPLGHRLEAPNLVPSVTKRGRRNCLACSRARAHARYHNVPDRVAEIADQHYERIMSK